MSVKSFYRQAGFILVTTMILLVMTTLLCMHMLQDSLMQHKMSYNFYYNNKLFNVMETALLEAEHIVAVTGITTPAFFEFDNKEDWLKYGKALAIQNAQARFTAQIIQSVCYKESKREHQIDFFRITVWILDQKSEYPLLVQSTYARIGTKMISDCLSEKAPKLGRQSWLQLR